MNRYTLDNMACPHCKRAGMLSQYLSDASLYRCVSCRTFYRDSELEAVFK